MDRADLRGGSYRLCWGRGGGASYREKDINSSNRKLIHYFSSKGSSDESQDLLITGKAYQGI